MLSLNDFQPVSPENKDLIEQYLRSYPQEHSDNTIINMLCWNHYAHYHYAIEDDALVIMTIVGGERTFRLPIGEQNDSLLRNLIALAAKEGGSIPLQILDSAGYAWLLRLYPHLPVIDDRDFADYVYLASDLADLKGRQYLTIRGEINRFRRLRDYTVAEMSGESMDEIREFLEKWCEWKHCDETPILAYERDAVFYAIDHFSLINASGMVVKTEEGIGAIAIYGELNPETLVIHFEKGLPGFEGIYKVINMETAAACQSRYTYINRESDMGVPGLREAKTRYHPHHMAPVRYVRKQDLDDLVLKGL